MSLPLVAALKRPISDTEKKLQQLRQPLTTSHPPSAARLAGCLLGRAGSLPQGAAHSVCRRRADCLPGAVASQHAHPPAPLWRSYLLLPWPAPGHHAPTGGPPVRPSCPCCQPVSHYLCIPHRLVLHVVAFLSEPELYRSHPCLIRVHKLGSSTLSGLAVRFQHVGLQSSHGGGAPRIIPLPISSRTYDLIRCASASATNSASFITCPS